MYLDDYGVNEVLRAADAVFAERCIGACLEHVNTPCIRWGDVIRFASEAPSMPETIRTG